MQAEDVQGATKQKLRDVWLGVEPLMGKVPAVDVIKNSTDTVKAYALDDLPIS